MLEISVRSRLETAYKNARDKGELPSEARLNQYYATFRENFGPDVLARYDGEELLEMIHNHSNHDSHGSR